MSSCALKAETTLFSGRITCYLLVPYRLAGGLLVCSLSIRQSVSHTSVFRTFLCCLLRFWLEIWYMNLSWHNTDQVWVSSRLTYFYRGYCPLFKFRFPDLFSAVFWDIDFKFGIWIYHHIIQIKFEFCHALPTFVGVIALCSNLVFRTFLCSLLRHWL